MAAATVMGTTPRSRKTTPPRRRYTGNITAIRTTAVAITATATATITITITITAMCTAPAAVTRLTIAMTSAAQLTALLHLASPALPVGAFSYSQGLEAAVEARHVHDEASAARWIAEGLAVLAACEAPLWLLQYADWQAGRLDAVAERDGWFLATRETRELRLETAQMGWSLARLIAQMGWGAPAMRDALAARAAITFPTAFAAAAVALGIEARDGLTAYSFAWVENQVAAAVKAIPLGQAAGQRILFGLHAAVGQAAEDAARRAACHPPELDLLARARCPVGPARDAILTTLPFLNLIMRTKKLPALRVGVGGPVGSGKTTLLEMLCKAMRERYDLVAITNDIYTKEDQRLLTLSARCRPSASWAWRRAAARTPPSAKMPRSTSKPSTACSRGFRMPTSSSSNPAATTWRPPSAPSCRT